MSCDACSRSRPTVCGCCHDTVVVTQPAFRQEQRLHLDELPFIDKGVAAAAGTEAGDRDVLRRRCQSSTSLFVLTL